MGSKYHIIAKCEKLKSKEQRQCSLERHAKAVGLISMPSIILAGVLMFSRQSACSNVLLRGVKMGSTRRSLHRVRIKSKLVSDVFQVAVCPVLPVRGVTLLLGNDIAGGRVISRKTLDRASRVSLRPDDADEHKKLPSRVPHRRTEKRKNNSKASKSFTNPLFPLLVLDDQVAAAASKSPAFDVEVKAARQTSHTPQVVGKPDQHGGRWSCDVDAGRLRWRGPYRQFFT